MTMKANNPAELVDIQAEVELRRQWSMRVGNGQGDNYNLLKPEVDGDRIFIASQNGNVVAADVASGDEIWSVRLREPVTGGVGADRDIVMLGTENAEVVALSQADGNELWRTQVSSEILAAPRTNGDVVVLQTIDDKLVALDYETGEQRWIYETTLPALTLAGYQQTGNRG